MPASLKDYFSSPCIRPGFSVLHRKQRNGHEVHFCSTAHSQVQSFLLNQCAFDCLFFLDGKNSAVDIAAKVGVSLRSVKQLIKVLVSSGVLNAQDYEHGETQYIPQINFLSAFCDSLCSPCEMQTKLTRARVAVIGIGGIGSWVAYGLALSGIGALHLIDPDIVESRNLNTQALYRSCDVGKPKTACLAEHLRQIRSNIHVDCTQDKLRNRANVIETLTRASLIINCADEPSVDAVNRAVSEIAHPAGIPHILCGGYDGHLSFLGPTIIPNVTPCWLCYEASMEREKRSKSLEHIPITRTDQQGGTIAPVAAITANIHVTEALKVIAGWSKPVLMSRTAEFDFGTMAVTYRGFRRRANCKRCATE